GLLCQYRDKLTAGEKMLCKVSAIAAPCLLLLLSCLPQQTAANAACSPGYSLLNDSAGPPTCLSPVSNGTLKFCDALDVCARLGHRLLTPNTYARARPLPQFTSGWILLGVTDALRERNRSRDGWQVMPGLREMNLTSSAWWASGEPGNQGGTQNCVLHHGEKNRLHDVNCWTDARYHCEHPAGSCIGGTG
uniref:C-type lectin domain-containing protein n=1 Tax=Macrostomum lignano TaxID=282301 RepID=A0A1I8JGX4_9PLAT